MDTLPVDEELCALSNGDGSVQRSELNMLIRRVSAYHLRPMKQQLTETDKSLKEHIESCALNQARIMGGLRVIQWLIGSGLLAFVLVSVGQFLGWVP